MIWRLLFCVILGVVGHRSNALFLRWEKENKRAWPLLGRYAVGGIMLSIATAIINRDVDLLVGSLAGCVAVGAGVGAGYVLDSFS